MLNHTTAAAAASRSASAARPRAGSPAADPRKTPTVAPFRDITRQPTSTSIDGRLLYMLKDYSGTVLPTQDHKVQNIASRLRRSKVLQAEEMTALETSFQRNQNFMATIERTLGEAVEKQVDMRRSVIHQAYEIWRACADANAFISTLLDTAQSAIGAGKYNKSNIQNYGAGTGGNRSISTAGATRHASPASSHSAAAAAAGGGVRFGTPTAFAQIPRPDAPSRQQLEPFHNSAANQFLQRTNVLRPVPTVAPALSRNGPANGVGDFSQNLTLPPNLNHFNHSPPFNAAAAQDPQAMFMSPTEAAARAQSQHYQHQQQQRGFGRMPSNERARSGSRPGSFGAAAAAAAPVGVQDAREAQAMFEKLFGPDEGRTRFLHWLSELPQSTIQQLHRNLSANQMQQQQQF